MQAIWSNNSQFLSSSWCPGQQINKAGRELSVFVMIFKNFWLFCIIVDHVSSNFVWIRIFTAKTVQYSEKIYDINFKSVDQKLWSTIMNLITKKPKLTIMDHNLWSTFMNLLATKILRSRLWITICGPYLWICFPKKSSS